MENVNLPNICPVCGFDLNEPPYKDGYPSYDICVCCGFEYGFDDQSEGHTFESYRANWIDTRFQFFDKKFQPANWNEAMMRIQVEKTIGLPCKPLI